MPLESLARGVARLWAREPHVGERLRTDLLGALGELDHRIALLILRTETGSSVDPVEVRSCARQYLWLREHWAESEIAT